MRQAKRWLPAVGIVLMCSVALGQNQNQNNGAPSFRGIVLRAAEDYRSFTIVDRDGSMVPIKVGASTTFEANRAPVNFAAAIVYGMDIRGTFAPDGSAATVSARGQASEIEDEQLQAFMGASEDEWAFLKPKIERVQALIRTAEGRGGGGNGGGNGDGNRGNAAATRNPVQELNRMLRTGFFSPTVPPAQLRTTLNALRAEQQRARAELSQARRDLQGFVTTRQEVLLVVMGVLD